MQAICDFVHQHIQFGYQFASPTKTAWEVFNERKGVCRDFAHLAITLCRCMNIPARYCTGYLGDIGCPPDPSPMDFAGWFEAYLGRRLAHVRPAKQRPPHRARPHRARPGRGRRGDHHHLRAQTLKSFRVWTDESVITRDLLRGGAAERGASSWGRTLARTQGSTTSPRSAR